ncbi:MAG: hypothetical protein K9L79_00320 [Methylobacter tundripaludum]|nr:hypothetical protein [Methylobacter tundripaludum]
MQRIDTATKFIDLFGAGKHGFRDGNKALGIAATQVNADLFNNVQEEICRVVEAAGITLDKTVFNQLLLALRGAGVFTTQPQYDSSTKAATTEYVNRVGLNSASVVVVSDNSLLTPDFGGKSVYCGVSATPTGIWLPLVSSVRRGTRIGFYNIAGDAGGIVSIYAQGSDIIKQPVTATSVPIGFGGWCELEADSAGQWFLVNISGLGVGQTWQLVTRSLNAMYYNTTAQPIVSIFNSSGGANLTCGHSVGGNNLPGFVASPTIQNQQFMSMALIPPYSSYMLLSNGTYQGSYELRC